MPKKAVSSRSKDIISNHKRIIVIAVAIVAISMYMAPFDKLMGQNTADAQPGKKCPPPGADNGNGLKYGIKKHVKCVTGAVKNVVQSTTGGIRDSVRDTVGGAIGGTSNSPSQAAHTDNVKPDHTDNVKPADSGKTIANDVKTKVKHSLQGNGDNTHTARASSNVKPSDSSKPSNKPDNGKLSDSIKSSIKSHIHGT